LFGTEEQRIMQIKAIGMLLAVCVATPSLATRAVAQVESPSQLYGKLFEDVQMQRVFPDSKTFVDAIAKEAPAIIVQRYQEEKQEPGFDLASFVARNFNVQRPKDSGYRSIPGQDVCSHIATAAYPSTMQTINPVKRTMRILLV
jgi:alpha,alpha-trehalase